MGNRQRDRLKERRAGQLLPRLNGVEGCLWLSEQYGDLFWGRKLMERDTVKAILRTLNEAHIRRPHYLRGPAVVMVFDVEGTHLDVMPANLRLKRTAVDNAIAVLVDDVPAKVVSVRDLLLLKLLAIPDRPELEKRRQDEADVTALLRRNADKISREDIGYIASSLRQLVFTGEDAQKYQELIRWLNDTLELLAMADRRYQEGEGGQANAP